MQTSRLKSNQPAVVLVVAALPYVTEVDSSFVQCAIGRMMDKMTMMRMKFAGDPMEC